MLKKTYILGVGITDASESTVLEYVFSFIKSGKKKGYIVTPNPEIVRHAQAHPEYRDILNKAEVSLCDGVGLKVAASILGLDLNERISGVDFMERLCKESVRNGVTVGFLGGKHQVALKTAECLSKKYKGLKVGFAGEEWNGDGVRNNELGIKSGDDKGNRARKMSTSIPDVTLLPNSSSDVDILFVAYGFPKQEEWIARKIDELPVKMAMGVGGAFDYISGRVPRAPFFIRALGGEWIFRLLIQPWRLKRQLSLVKFMYLVLKERFSAGSPTKA